MKKLVLLFGAFALIGCGEKKEVDRNAEAGAGSGINEPVEPSGPSQPKKPSEKQIQLSAIYWTDTTNQKIQRSNPDGANVEDVVDGVDSPEQIAVDSVGKHIYWADGKKGEIQRADLDGSNPENLVTGLESPRGIALDAAQDKIYWTDFPAYKIQRANLDGSEVEDLVTRNCYNWYNEWNYVELHATLPFHIFKINK